MTEVAEQRITQSVEPSSGGEWMRLARWGATGLVGFSLGLQLVVGLIPPVLVIGVVFGVLAVFLTGERRRLGLIAATLAAVTIVGNAPFIIEDLAHPNGGWVFALTLLSVLAGAAVIIGGLGVFFGWSPKPIFAIAVTFGAILAMGTVVSLVSAASEDSVVAAAADVAVTAQGVQFGPTEIVLTADSSGVWIDNKDGVRHTFTIDDLAIDLELPGNTARRVDIEAPSGEYAVVCEVPGHENMLATLTIEG